MNCLAIINDKLKNFNNNFFKNNSQKVAKSYQLSKLKIPTAKTS